MALLDWFAPLQADRAYAHPEIAMFVFVSIAAGIYFTVSSFVERACLISEQDVIERFGHARDRILVRLQFWLTLLGAAGIPFVLYMLRNAVQRV